MKSVTLNIQLKDLSESKQQELQKIIKILYQNTNLEPDDIAFKLYVNITFHADGSQHVR